MGLLSKKSSVSAVSANSELASPYLGRIKSFQNKRPNNEEFWSQVADLYPRPEGITNLEHGYFSHSSIETMLLQHQFSERINRDTSLFMRREQENEIEKVRKIYADYQKVETDELAFTRNTTESLNIAIMGFPWQAGDELLYGDQDYGSMNEAILQVKERFSISLNRVEVSCNPSNDEELIRCYLKNITPKTKMILITHLINYTGHLLPIIPLLTAIKTQHPNIILVVDSAHSLSHTTTSIGEMRTAGADVVGSSLHKWLCNPLGVGVLFMNRKHIEKFWPLTGDTGTSKTSIKKFEHQGTRPVQSIMTIPNCINELESIGAEARLNRLRYLKWIWIGNKKALLNIAKTHGFDKDEEFIRMSGSLTDLTKNEKFSLLCPDDPERGGAISTFSIKFISPSVLASKLKDQYSIFTVAIEHPVIKGIRVTPHLSTRLQDVIKMNTALTDILGN